MSDESITITVGDATYVISKLERHLLYALEEDRPWSRRLYTVDQAIAGYDALQFSGLVAITTQGEELTVRGREVVAACRTRPRTP